MSTVQVDNIVDAAGTGAPNFTNGATSSSTSATETVSGMVKKNQWQKKALTVDVSSSGTITELQFNNLTIGKTYKFSLVLYVESNNNFVSGRIQTGSTVLAAWGHRSDGNLDAGAVSAEIMFVADTTTVYPDTTTLGGTLFVANQDGASPASYAILEELDNYTSESSSF